MLTPLTALSPIDGRYYKGTEKLSAYFSEFALIKTRLFVEVEYFIALYEIPLPQLKKIELKKIEGLRSIYETFDEKEAEKVKSIEQKINHDVKAIEYYLKERLEKEGLKKYIEFVHFGLTSQDLNNTALPFLLKKALYDEYLPVLDKIIKKLKKSAEDWKDIPMLAYTHGQPASPTLLGKEVMVFIERLERQKEFLKQLPFYAKFGGAIGNFNAHYVAYPDIDWHQFADNFIKKTFNIERLHYTTQVSHYDNSAAIFDNLKRINTIFIDLCRDYWTYISMDYFKQVMREEEVGSSTMPHKINPIDFENAEGNLGVANNIFEFLSSKLPISRLQRDLTDSTVTRNIGVPIAHTLLAFSSILKGLEKLLLNEGKIQQDLEVNWAVVAEAIQSILRREGYPEPYEKLKELTRTHVKITKKCIQDFIASLDVSDNVKLEMLRISPHNYTGSV